MVICLRYFKCQIPADTPDYVTFFDYASYFDRGGYLAKMRINRVNISGVFYDYYFA